MINQLKPLAIFLVSASLSLLPSWAVNLTQVEYENGKHFLSKNHPHQAIECFDRVIKIDPNFVDAHYYRAIALTDVEERTRALSDVNMVLQHWTTAGPAYRLRGRILFELGKRGLAITDMTKAISVSASPEEKACYTYERGKLFRESKFFGRAIADFTSAIALNPKNCHYYYQRGHVLLAQGKAEKAVEDFTNALKYVKPKENDCQIYYSSRALAYDKLGRHDLAELDKKKVASEVQDTFGSFFPGSH